MKKVLLMLVAIATIALVSCKKDVAASSASQEASADTTKTEAVDSTAEEANDTTLGELPEPTGDVAADAKTFADYTLTCIKKEADSGFTGEWKTKYENLDQKFTKFYEKNGKINDFNSELTKYAAAVQQATAESEKLYRETSEDEIGKLLKDYVRTGNPEAKAKLKELGVDLDHPEK